MKLTEKQHINYANFWFLTGMVVLCVYGASYGWELPLLIIILFCLFETHLWSKKWYNKYVKRVK